MFRFIRNILTDILLILAFSGAAQSAQIVNVDYIHKYIKQKHGITIEYPNKNQIMWAANMKYLLTAVDVANEILNGEPITSYGTDSKYATLQAVDTIAAQTAIDTLITKNDTPIIRDELEFKPATSSQHYYFNISASGTFYIDWGDGTKETFEKPDTNNKPFIHTYPGPAKNYTVLLSGDANTYNKWDAAISFTPLSNAEIPAGASPEITQIHGCLTCVFGVVSDGTPPSFFRSFYGNTELTSITENLFKNVTEGRENMFGEAFRYSGLTAIPNNLFANMTRGAVSMFESTFADCPNLVKIGDGVFKNLENGELHMFESTFKSSGVKTIGNHMFAKLKTGADYMFNNAFMYTNLTSVPGDMFESLETGGLHMFDNAFAYNENLKTIGNGFLKKLKTGDEYMFFYTFNTTGLTSAPDDMFYNLTNGSDYMFSYTFAETPNMKHAGNNWFASMTNATTDTFSYLFAQSGVESLGDNWFSGLKTGPTSMFKKIFNETSNLKSVGNNWFASVTSGTDSMFQEMFYNTGLTTIGSGWFVNLKSGAPNMFRDCFRNTHLTQIPSDMFGDIQDTTYPSNMFSGTFANCPELSGDAAKIGAPGARKYFWEKWPDVASAQSTYDGDTLLNNYDNIPSVWR